MNRKQNKGFTLVEVLIAITILGIIVVPLFQAFVTSANTNAKAKRVMDATTLAQSIVEELKAGNLEDLAKQFNGSEESTVITLGDSQTGYAEEPQRYVADEAHYSVDADGEFVGQTSGRYSFLMRNVPVDSSAYDVVIEVTENAGGTQELANVYSMNQSDCGYYVQTENMDQRAAAEFQIRNAAYVYEGAEQKNVTEFISIMQRTITVTIKKESVDVNYLYTIPDKYVAGNRQDATYSQTTTIFQALSEEENLKAVYLYFYSHDNDTGDFDKIVISNQENLDVDVFLVQMQQGESVPGEQDPVIIELSEMVQQNSTSQIKIHSNLTSCSLWSINETQFFNTLSSTESTTSLYDVKVEVYQHQSEASKEFLLEYLLGTYSGSFRDNSQIKK